MATALEVLKLAQSQLGYKETPSGSNKTKYGKEYGMNGVAWCAIFVWWVCKHAGESKAFYGGKKCAYCPTIADYYISKKQTVSKSSGQPGDIVLFGFGHTNSQHIGFIEKKNSDGSYTCIEGNTSTGNNCNGGQVMRRTRYKSQINWIVRPNYSGSSFEKPTTKYDGTIPTPTLKSGSRGDNVKNLQKFLSWYCGDKLDVDGDFGGATESALIIFQLAEGISADGEYGKKSYEKVLTYKAEEKVETKTKEATVEVKQSTTIGHAKSDSDGKAGDSSGKEVAKSKFSYSSKSTSAYNWTYVFRPKDYAKADKAATMCEKAIKNNNIGYCKNGTKAYGDNALEKIAVKVGYDLSKISVKTGCSCGDLICLCNRYASLSTCYIGSALGLAKEYKTNENFDCLSYKKGMSLQRGDVIITAHSNGKNNHVAMCL